MFHAAFPVANAHSEHRPHCKNGRLWLTVPHNSLTQSAFHNLQLYRFRWHRQLYYHHTLRQQTHFERLQFSDLIAATEPYRYSTFAYYIRNENHCDTNRINSEVYHILVVQFWFLMRVFSFLLIERPTI